MPSTMSSFLNAVTLSWLSVQSAMGNSLSTGPLPLLFLFEACLFWFFIFIPTVSSSFQQFLLSSHCLNLCLCLICCVLCAQPWPTLCDPMDCSPPGSTVHGILQAGILEWVAISFSTLYVVFHCKHHVGSLIICAWLQNFILSSDIPTTSW